MVGPDSHAQVGRLIKQTNGNYMELHNPHSNRVSGGERGKHNTDIQTLSVARDECSLFVLNLFDELIGTRYKIIFGFEIVVEKSVIFIS